MTTKGTIPAGNPGDGTERLPTPPVGRELSEQYPSPVHPTEQVDGGDPDDRSGGDDPPRPTVTGPDQV